MTQETLASLTGFTQPQISKIESGTRKKVDIEDIRKFAKALDIPVLRLLEDNPSTKAAGE